MKFLKWLVIALVALVAIGFAFFQFYMIPNTKKASPEDTITYTQGNVNIEVFYNRPYAKDRDIFGGLVPYNEVWRTGANEATTFETNKDLEINGQTLPAGKYTLWTIPNPEQWEVIFNDKMYSWGVGWNAKASRNPELDKVNVKVLVQELEQEVEQFTIAIENQGGLQMTIAWDDTKVAVPMKVK